MTTSTPNKSIRARNCTKSLIRELLKLANKPEIISFAGGLPSPKSFPVEQIGKATADLLETEGTHILQYSYTEGEPRLRKAIAKRETEKGNVTD